MSWIPLRSHVAAALLVAVVLALPARAVTPLDPPAYGRSPDDLAMEEFLSTAEVVSVEDVGIGITEPLLMVLRRGDEQHRAIFKTVDIELDQPAQTDRLEQNFTDKYTYEAAAYRLDRVVGMGLVPVTVIREINGQTGSLQYWVENVISLEAAMAAADTEVENFDLLVQRLMIMYVLDALIYNIDRNYGNVLVNLEEDIFHPIDHSRAFRLTGKPPPVNAQTRKPIPVSIADPLRSLDLETLQATLGEFLEPRQVRAVIKRRDKLVKMLAREALLPQG